MNSDQKTVVTPESLLSHVSTSLRFQRYNTSLPLVHKTNLPPCHKLIRTLQTFLFTTRLSFELNFRHTKKYFLGRGGQTVGVLFVQSVGPVSCLLILTHRRVPVKSNFGSVTPSTRPESPGGDPRTSSTPVMEETRRTPGPGIDEGEVCSRSYPSAHKLDTFVERYGVRDRSLSPSTVVSLIRGPPQGIRTVSLPEGRTRSLLKDTRPVRVLTFDKLPTERKLGNSCLLFLGGFYVHKTNSLTE